MVIIDFKLIELKKFNIILMTNFKNFLIIISYKNKRLLNFELKIILILFTFDNIICIEILFLKFINISNLSIFIYIFFFFLFLKNLLYYF
jgi:hypothetical protein